MPGRNILEGVVLLHGTIRELHTKKLPGSLFKAVMWQGKPAFSVTTLAHERVSTRAV
jgi:hypothetical protein